MVGAFAPYIIKRRRAEIVRGYCYRFLQCSFPCGIIMLIFSILFILLGAGQLIYILRFNGCNPVITTASESTTTKHFPITSPSSSPPPPTLLLPLFKCNRATMKVLGITFLVTGIVLFVISVLVTKYSRSSEENNVIRTTTSSSSHPTTSKHHHHPPHPICHYSLTPLSSMHDLSHAALSTR